MGRPKKSAPTEDVKQDTVDAESFLQELEDGDEPIILDEDEEIVGEQDILAELEREKEAEKTASPEPDLFETETPVAKVAVVDLSEVLGGQAAMAKTLSKILDRVEGLSSLLKAMEDLQAQVAKVADNQTLTAKAVASMVQSAKTSAGEKPVTGKPSEVPAPTNVVDKYMVDTIKEVVSGFPDGFSTDLKRIAKAIHSKKFAGDPGSLPKVEALCEKHLPSLGKVVDGVFTRGFK